MNYLKVGDIAPDFTLMNTEKKPISLSDLKSQNTVILFFPLAFTSVCTAELCSVRDNLSVYNAFNAVVLGISVDSLFTLDRFKSDQKLTFDLLSDFNKEVSKSYHALYEDFVLGMKGVSKRAAFVVDKKGIIKYAEVLEDAGQQPNFEEIQKCLAELN